MADKVTLPRYVISQILRQRDQLMQGWDPYVGQVPDMELLQELARPVCELLRAPMPLVLASIEDLLGVPLSVYQSIATPWRLAGNKMLLRQQPVRPWVRQLVAEWVPVEFNDGFACTQPNQRRQQYLFTVRILAGTSCPMLCNYPISGDYALALGTRMLGYTKPQRAKPMQHPRELVGLRAFLYADPATSTALGPAFTDVECSPGLLRHNKEVIAARWRDGFDCPYSYTHACHRCHIGRTECIAATRSVTGSYE